MSLIGDKEIVERAVQWLDCVLLPNSNYEVESGWRAIKGQKPAKWFRVFMHVQEATAEGTSDKSLTEAVSRAFDQLAPAHPWLLAKVIEAAPMFPQPVTRGESDSE